ncbi:Gram positive anchor [Staphylococcus caprae]|uniref:LPXTG cell wall anchor domain-containing protein n=1 Tax=Staphylococcus caprae TaxID=29380 RepID=UPI000E0710AF|nr:LPXTG cell wall anchor domain-containing protein [Staphylococcus caprae]SUL95865.1 Gram positive anchor [Staphylococcus caprae]
MLKNPVTGGKTGKDSGKEGKNGKGDDKDRKGVKKEKGNDKDYKNNQVSKTDTVKDSKVNKNDSDSKSTNELPQTGSHKESNNGVIFSLIALFSSLFFIKRKSNKNI